MKITFRYASPEIPVRNEHLNTGTPAAMQNGKPFFPIIAESIP